MISTTSSFFEYLYMLLYFSSTRPFLNMHLHSVELNCIRYNIHCFDNYASIYYVMISVYLSITPC